jgi:transcription antitermination factor NusG
MTELIISSDAVWTAAHTKPRCEKVVVRYCDAHGIPCYLPLRRRMQRYQRRTVETFLPMFPGYVFVQTGSEQQSLLMQSNRVVAIFAMDRTGEAQLLEELRAIQAMEAAAREGNLVVQPEIIAGRKVLITGGPLNGTVGIVERRRQKVRVTVNVNILGQSVSVELDIGEVTAANDD